MRSGRILTSFYLAAVCLLALGENATDVTEGGVTISFNSVTPMTWNKNGRPQLFQKALSAVANGYCSKNTAKCSLSSWNIARTFEPSNIAIVSGFPQRRDADLDVKFYITYPPGQDISGNSRRVLPSSTVKEIVLTNKENISDVVGETIKSVGGDMGGDDDDEKRKSNFLNYVMIPLTVALLIILCVVTCCLQHCKNKKVRALEAQRRQQLEMKNQSKPQTPQVEEQVTSGGGQRRKKRVKRKKKKEKRDEELGSSDDAPKKPTQANGTTVWFEDEEQLSSRGKSKKHKQRKHRGSEAQQPEEPGEGNNVSRHHKDLDGHNSETKDIETDEVDTDQQQKRKKKKKKKHRKRYAHRVDNEGSGASEQRWEGTMVLSDSQLGRLPSIRNLPPLKERQSVEA